MRPLPLHTLEPDGELLYLSEDHVDRSAVGMRVGGVFPLTPWCIASFLGGRCAQASLSVGYTPFPAFVMFETHIYIPIH
jgi:hypothetical protein